MFGLLALELQQHHDVHVHVVVVLTLADVLLLAGRRVQLRGRPRGELHHSLEATRLRCYCTTSSLQKAQPQKDELSSYS